MKHCNWNFSLQVQNTNLNAMRSNFVTRYEIEYKWGKFLRHILLQQIVKELHICTWARKYMNTRYQTCMACPVCLTSTIWNFPCIWPIVSVLKQYNGQKAINYIGSLETSTKRERWYSEGARLKERGARLKERITITFFVYTRYTNMSKSEPKSCFITNFQQVNLYRSIFQDVRFNQLWLGFYFELFHVIQPSNQ